MADSYSCPDFEKIHIDLIEELINGHVGFKEDTDSHTNWKMKFRIYCDQTTERTGSVRGNFEYLEKKKIITPGKYDVLKEIFVEDNAALKKIEKATVEIEKMKPPEKSLKKIHKEAKLSLIQQKEKNEDTNSIHLEEIILEKIEKNIEIVVEVKNEDNAFLRKMTSFLRKLVNEFKSEFSTLPWIETGQNFVQHRDIAEQNARISAKMMHFRKSLEQLLSEEHINRPQNVSKKILGIYFALLHTIEKELGMTISKIVGEQSVIFLVKTASGNKGDDNNKYMYKSLKEKVRSCFQEIFLLKGRGYEVFVEINDIQPLDADNVKLAWRKTEINDTDSKLM